MAVFEPEPVSGCVSTTIKSRVYVWGGKKMESGDISHLGNLYILDTRSEEWLRRPINGEHPAGFNNCTAAAQDSGVFYIYGGQDKDDKFMGSLHCLDLDHLKWKELSSHTLDGPKKKICCGMVICGDRIILFGGRLENSGCTNELHLFNLLTETWSCPDTTGAIPPPCFAFSLVQTNAITAMLFGGFNEGTGASDQLYKLRLTNLHWSKVPRKDGDAWPEERYYHDGYCIAPNTDHTQLLISGGRKEKYGKYYDDIWLLEVESMTWTKATEKDHAEDPLPGSRTELYQNHYAELCEQLSQVKNRWADIARSLGFLPIEIAEIQSNPMRMTTGNYIYDVIEFYLRWAPGDKRGSKDVATLEELQHALNKTNLARIRLKITDWSS